MPKLKKGPLGKSDIFYIEGKCMEMSAPEIAQDLNRSITSVENYIKKNIMKNSNRITVGDQFVRQSGVTIMSENASTMSDATRKPKKQHNEKCITKIKVDQ